MSFTTATDKYQYISDGPTHLQFNEFLNRRSDILGNDFYIDDQSSSVAFIYGIRLLVFGVGKLRV